MSNEPLRFELHEAQLEIHDDPSRFKVVVAGRRFGKSFLARVELAVNALQDVNEYGDDLSQEEVYYVAPTFEQGKKIMWNPLKALLGMEHDGGLIKAAHENTAVITLINERRISIKGADRPDSLRGVGLSYVVLDEYAFMKPDVWELIIQPALARTRGRGLFIGTPDGKNHFYDLYVDARDRQKPAFKTGWRAWQFESLANPTLDQGEISRQISTMSVSAARQEFGASFNSGGGLHLREEWWKTGPEPEDGDYYIAVDLAGFSSSSSVKKGVLKIKDRHSIAVVKVGTYGWWVKEIISGQWDVRRTALEIVNIYRTYRPVKLGIEKGVLKNAVGPYLEDEMKRLNCFFTVWDLAHGGNKKEDRIRWALQGRLEKGRLKLNSSDDPIDWAWRRQLIEQGNDFPSPLAHDDDLDSLAYIDQLADVSYFEGPEPISWEPLDLVSGF